MRGYDEELIEEIRYRNDIVEVISEYVPLRRAGKNYLGLCPFHHERTPSFTVSPEKQMFYCFGCQAGGNLFTFLMKKDNMSFLDAVRTLAERAGVPLPQEEGSPEEAQRRKERELTLQVLALAAEFYHRVLLESGKGEEARRYLKSRGLEDETVSRFHLGWAPAEWEALTSTLVRRGFSPDLLVRAGLASPREQGSGCYDRFRGRVMFPIRDRRGRVLGFGGRVLGDGQPKYLNSPETRLFNKRSVLFGLDLAAGAIRSAGRAVVVEGYMDVITAHQHGITNTVASLGTALSREQAALVRQYAPLAILAYDSDTAGEKATLRGLDIFGDLGVEVRVATLPEGKDPDEFLRRQGSEAFRRVLDRAVPLFEFRFRLACRQHDTATVQGKVKVVAEVAQLLAAMDNAVERTAYIQRVARALGVAPDAVATEVQKLAGRRPGWARDTSRARDNTKSKSGVAKNPRQLPAHVRAELDILRFALRDPAAAARVYQELGSDSFSLDVHRMIAGAIFEVMERGGAVDPGQIVSGLDDEGAIELVTRLALDNVIYFQPERTLADCITTVKEHRLKERIAALQEQIRDLEARGEKVDQRLLAEYLNLVRTTKLH